MQLIAEKLSQAFKSCTTALERLPGELSVLTNGVKALSSLSNSEMESETLCAELSHLDANLLAALAETVKEKLASANASSAQLCKISLLLSAVTEKGKTNALRCAISDILHDELLRETFKTALREEVEKINGHVQKVVESLFAGSDATDESMATFWGAVSVMMTPLRFFALVNEFMENVAAADVPWNFCVSFTTDRMAISRLVDQFEEAVIHTQLFHDVPEHYRHHILFAALFFAATVQKEPELAKLVANVLVSKHYALLKAARVSVFDQHPWLLRLLVNNNIDAPASTTTEESLMDYYRHEPFLQEHHFHWHTVNFDNARRDRQGELFFYMHRQMLARYNTERALLGLAPVLAFADMDDGDYTASPVPHYNPPCLPHDYCRVPGLTWTTEQAQRMNLLRGETLNYLQSAAPTLDELGSYMVTMSPTSCGSEEEKTKQSRKRGEFHNRGHMYFAMLSQGRRGGVMADTFMAAMDPVFYAWHQHIDDFAWRLVCRAGAWSEQSFQNSLLPDAVIEQFSFMSAADSDCRIDTLRTFLQPISFMSSAGVPIATQILMHSEYYLRIVLRSSAGSRQARHTTTRVTVRVFAVLDELFLDERQWMELDTFVVTMNVSGEETTFLRHSSMSSVVKREKSGRAASRPSISARSPLISQEEDAEDFCDCGWPYHLLMPRGTALGAHMRVFALLTDGEDISARIDAAGSARFCGRAQTYPDRKPMGFPFHQPGLSSVLREKPLETSGHSYYLTNIILKHVA